MILVSLHSRTSRVELQLKTKVIEKVVGRRVGKKEGGRKRAEKYLMSNSV